jgi:hypothetical protein
VAQLLLAAGGGGQALLMQTTADGETCLDMAVKSGHTELAQWLARAGGDALLAQSKWVVRG